MGAAVEKRALLEQRDTEPGGAGRALLAYLWAVGQEVRPKTCPGLSVPPRGRTSVRQPSALPEEVAQLLTGRSVYESLRSRRRPYLRYSGAI